MSRKICVVTGTRAEFGLLRWLIQEIQHEPELELQVLATGMHLSPEFGLTYREIEQAGFVINAKVEMLLSADTATAVTKSMGLGLISYADAYERLAPDLIVVLGDRFEIFAATAAALIAGIPVAHLHGGETTEGAFDEAIRHSITKMSHLHFVAAEEYPQARLELDMERGDFHVKCPYCQTNAELRATTEDSQIHPSSIYGITKQNQEQMILTVGASLGIQGQVTHQIDQGNAFIKILTNLLATKEYIPYIFSTEII